MKFLLEIFSAVIYFQSVASSYRHHGFNNNPNQFSGMPGSSDYANFGKVHRKRYSSVGQGKLVANDLLNSYFKLGSFPIANYAVAPSAEMKARSTLVGEPIKPKVQPTSVKKVTKAPQPKKQSPLAQIRAPVMNKPPPTTQVIANEKPVKPAVDPKPVKRPVIIIGHKRGGAGRGPAREQSIRRYVAPASKV